MIDQFLNLTSYTKNTLHIADKYKLHYSVQSLNDKQLFFFFDNLIIFIRTYVKIYCDFLLRIIQKRIRT